jgi:hypothetical protein
MASSSSSRSSVPRPEDGLAEWTSKIKAMQQQVDADEEAEQRKLEEEIARSRLARIRRSQLGYGTKYTSAGASESSIIAESDCVISRFRLSDGASHR